MRKHIAILVPALCMALATYAQVPERVLTTDVNDASVANVQLRSGDSVDLVWRLRQAGTNWFPASASAAYQTNGMGRLWWEAPASVNSNEVRVSWTPALDPGSSPVLLLVRVGGSAWRCAAQLRILHGPGETPNVLVPPVASIDFSSVAMTNAPWVLEETDPTVPAWAKAEAPPVAEEVDPTVPAWAKAETPPLSAESDPVFQAWAATNEPPVAVESDPVFSTWLSTNSPSAPEPQPVPVYAWPGDWKLAVTDAGSTNGAGISTSARADYLSLVAASEGVYRRYRVEAVPEMAVIPGGTTTQPVSLSVRDPDGCVASFEDGVVGASGTPGTAFVTGVDTTGVSRTAAVAMTPVRQGAVVTEMYAESPPAERHVWATNLLARLAAVSTNAGDMVGYDLCRPMTDLYNERPNGFTRYFPRALSRFGTGGRVVSDEWDWSSAKGGRRARRIPHAVNAEFFWPELQEAMTCYTVQCHESAEFWTQRFFPWTAVAPHYMISAGHYGGYYSGYNPMLLTNVAAQAFMELTPVRVAGYIPDYNGSKADTVVIEVAEAIPSNCIARFATDAVMERLSKSFFTRCAALTLTDHQTVAPLCVRDGDDDWTGSHYSWWGEPGASANTGRYLNGAGDTGPAMAFEHPAHMYDSGCPVFLASPGGRIVPLTHMCTAGGGSALGPRYGAMLESLSAMVRADSGGREDLLYWSFEELWSGVGTNSLENLP